MRLTITGLSLGTPTPSPATCHPRRNPATNNIDHGWLDEFAVQVATTATTRILCRVLKVDTNSGWGQDLRLDFLIVEQTQVNLLQ
jgi:hypothetical protein